MKLIKVISLLTSLVIVRSNPSAPHNAINRRSDIAEPYRVNNGQTNVKLPKVTQYITTHNPNTGKAVFSDSIPEDVTTAPSGDPMEFTLLYATDTFPVDMNNDSDLKVFAHYQKNPPSLVNTNGTVLRIVDFAPGNTSAPIMHRTISLDYAVVLEGQIELILDSGEKRLMKRADFAIQRGTKHAWRNPSPNEWARMLFVLQPSKPIRLNAQQLEEEYAVFEGR
jgi:quercetin dioxygenase-like cupin family protein